LGGWGGVEVKLVSLGREFAFVRGKEKSQNYKKKEIKLGGIRVV